MGSFEKKGLTRRSFLAAGGAAAVAAAASVALASCGGSSSSNAASSASASEAPSSSKGSSSAASNELTGAFSSTSTNVNPVGNSSVLMLTATRHVFEGLYDLDLHTCETYPALAAGDPTKVSDTEYEIALRPGAKFSDGADVKAADVVNAFEKNISDDTYGAFLSFIDSISAADDTTVVFKLKYPFESLLKGRLSLVKIFPASLSENDLNTKPIGSGPWMYESINGDDDGLITFKPNDHYEGSYPATAKTMTWSIMLDNEKRMATFSDEGIAVVQDVPYSSAEQLIDAGATVGYEQGFNQAFLMFNCQKPPFDDPRVRQAFFYAIDVEALIEERFDGHATPVTGFLPKDHRNYHKASTVYTYNPSQAKKLLADADVADLSVTMIVNNNWVKDLARSIKKNLDAVGISATIVEQKIDWLSYMPREDGSVNEDFDFMLTPGDPTCYGDDPDLLMSWWYGDNVWTRGRSCWALAGDGKFEQLQELLQQAREADGDEQQALWNECFDLIAENVPLYALFHREMVTGYQESKITGFEPISAPGLVFLGASPA
jgi:peptide/nickel transport system substrate-binding protein